VWDWSYIKALSASALDKGCVVSSASSSNHATGEMGGPRDKCWHFKKEKRLTLPTIQPRRFGRPVHIPITQKLTPCHTVLEKKPTTSLSTQEIPLILWNPQLHCSVLRCRSLGPVLSQASPFHVNLLYLRSILILSSHLCLCLQSGLFPFRFPKAKSARIYPNPRHTYIFLDVFMITYGKECTPKRLTK